MAITKSVDGEDLSASNFAFVGDENDPSTWVLPVHDETHVRFSLDRFGLTPPQEIPVEERKGVAERLLTAAKKFGIDASGLALRYGVKEASRAEAAVYRTAHIEAEALWPGEAVRHHRFAARAVKLFAAREARKHSNERVCSA